MPRLPSLSGREVQRALERAGFEVVRQRGSHIRMRHPDGRVVTVPIHQGRVIGRGLLRKILRDAEISREQLVEFLET